MKKALITGITGQDGSYLAEFLLSKNYEVYGLALKGEQLLPSLEGNVTLYEGSLADDLLIDRLIKEVKPDEVYNLGAQSNVRKSFDMAVSTGDITGLGVVRLLEAIKKHKPDAKLYQASSCEMFGDMQAPQSETTSFSPLNPYASAKVYAYNCVKNYREAFGMFVCSGILFHHESPRRPVEFVTRKITHAVASIVAGKQKSLLLGNLNVKRDWGFSPEYVEVMWLMLQQNKPHDFVVGTGQSHTAREFVEEAFHYVGIDLAWIGEGLDQVGIVKKTTCKAVTKGEVLVAVNECFFRPTDGNYLEADITKIKDMLTWQPKVFLSELVAIMVDADLLKLGLNSKRLSVRANDSKTLQSSC